MGKLHHGDNWLIRVQINEHPPVHVHIVHPDGRAILYLDGTLLNQGVPHSVIRQASAWVADHESDIRAEWARVHNPPSR